MLDDAILFSINVNERNHIGYLDASNLLTVFKNSSM